MESLASSANQQSLPPELVPEPNSLNRGEELIFAVPIDGQDGAPQYNALVNGSDAKAQLGLDLPIVMHINVAGKELAIVDLRSRRRNSPGGGRHVDIYDADANGHTIETPRKTRWDADFLVVGKEWNGGGMYRRGDRGYLGIRPPAVGDGEVAADMVFGAGDGKCRHRFNLPADMPQDAFHISYDGTNLKVTATEPITVTRMVEKAADTAQTEPAERQAYESSAPEEAIMTEPISSAPGPEENRQEQATIEAGPVMLDEDLGDVPVSQHVEPEQASASEASVEPEAVPEVHRPSASEIFESPDAFAKALADEQLDPELRNQLHDLQSAWREVHVAVDGNQLWDSHVRAALHEATDTLALMKRDGDDIEHSIQALRGNLHRLSEALWEWQQSLGTLDANRVNNAGEAVRSVLGDANFTGELDRVRTEGKKLGEQGFDLVANRLDWHAIETDELYRDMHRYDGSMAEWPTQLMAQEVGDMVKEGADLQTITERLRGDSEERSALWRRRRDGLEALAQLAHRTQNAAWVEADRAYNAWETIRELWSRGSMPSGQDLNFVSHLLGYPLEEAELFGRLARSSEAAIEETR